MAIYDYNGALSKAEGEYTARVYFIADCTFEKIVKPFLIKHNYSFAAGMGAWVIYDSRGRSIDENKIPRAILAALQADVQGMGNNDLGSLMPDFKQ